MRSRVGLRADFIKLNAQLRRKCCQLKSRTGSCRAESCRFRSGKAKTPAGCRRHRCSDLGTRDPSHKRRPGDQKSPSRRKAEVIGVDYGLAEPSGEALADSGGLPSVALAFTGLLVSVGLKRVRYGMNGVTSNGIFSRSATRPTGLLLSSARLSYQGSSFTRPPIGRAAMICGFAFVSGAVPDFKSPTLGTRFPR